MLSSDEIIDHTRVSIGSRTSKAESQRAEAEWVTGPDNASRGIARLKSVGAKEQSFDRVAGCVRWPNILWENIFINITIRDRPLWPVFYVYTEFVVIKLRISSFGYTIVCKEKKLCS